MKTVTVKCPVCGAKRVIKPGELGKLDYPLCDNDGMPMEAVKAK